jgi:LPS-assembly protein
VAGKYLSLTVGFWLFAAAASESVRAQSAAGTEQLTRPRAEIRYRDGILVLTADILERINKTRFSAKGNVHITFQDMAITCDTAEYDEVTQEGKTTGSTRFVQNQQWLTCSRAEFNLAKQTGKFYDATGRTDQEFLLQGKTVLKTGRSTYVVERGFLTACEEPHPKWGFSVGTAKLNIDQTARLQHVVFKVKGVPVLYLPFLVVPLQNKERNSGFLPFHTGSSTSKGRQFSLGYFQTLGESADVTFYGDYYSLRGMGYGGILRARPNAQTHLDLTAYGVRDRLNQGGALLVVDGASRLKNGLRMVASVNITTNFLFRQAFSEGFRSATVSQERSSLFASRNADNFSTNIAYERHEVLFPSRSIVIRKLPSIEFLALGKSLGRLPLIFTLRAAAEGMARSDSVMATPPIVQRFDFHPRLSLRMPSVAGFSLIPSFGVRETYYSARISKETVPTVVSTPLRRQYTDLEVELRTPKLERSFRSARFGDFRHMIEPLATYRRIRGISSLRETIRFDEEDAIADTSEVEYGFVNRIIRRREIKPGIREDFEFLSLSVAQKYYFDQDFGGAFLPGESNIFYPLNTLTGFASTGIRRSLAPTSMNLRVTPRPGISYDVHANYDNKLHRLRDSSLSAFWQQDRLFLAGTYFKTNALEAGMFENNHIQGQIGYGAPTRGLSASLTLSYNIRTRTLLNSNSRLNYAWNCCGVSLEFQQFDIGLRTESRFSFSFSLKGIGSFGNIKRPESLF